MKIRFFSHELFTLENSPFKMTIKKVRSAPQPPRITFARSTQRAANLELTSDRSKRVINPANDRRVEDGFGQLDAHSPIVASKPARSRSQPAVARFGVLTVGHK